MDCGPAALKSLLEGFGISASYGRLREACQTDVDGTSINTLEDVAQRLGLHAQQMMAPADHLLLASAHLLPALVVTVLPNGFNHFVVAWRTHGPIVQLMDPATGRRWSTQRRFLNEVYHHSAPFDARAWRAWAETDGFVDPLRQRQAELDLPISIMEHLLDVASADEDWIGFGALDAATRMVTSLVRANGIARGNEAAHLLGELFEQAHQADAATAIIPEPFWSARPLPKRTNAHSYGDNGANLLLVRGAVFLKIAGVYSAEAQASAPSHASDVANDEVAIAHPAAETESAAETDPTDSGAGAPTAATHSSILTAALAEATQRPEWEIVRALRQDGMFRPTLLLGASLVAALSVTAEAALLRGFMVLATDLHPGGWPLSLLAGLVAFVLFAILLEFPIAASAMRMGRKLETRIRIAFLTKIPRLGDRYFHSRLISDMAQRAYGLRQLHALPDLALRIFRLCCQLIFTAAGVIWLFPAAAPIALLAVSVSVAGALLIQPMQNERDMRVRTHTGALSRFYLDALIGLMPIRTHSAERTVRREHEMMLAVWARESLSLARIGAAAQSLAALMGVGFAASIVLAFIFQRGEMSTVLLLLYWSLNLPVLGQSLADAVRQYPTIRNNMGRILEPLGAPEEEMGLADTGDSAAEGAMDEQAATTEAAELAQALGAGVALQLEAVTVQAGGHVILDDINVTIAPGEHVAIVGESGAGKSTLAGLLLGWHRPANGRVWVNGELLAGERLWALRRLTAWVDPSIQLWNRSLQENLRYGSSKGPAFAEEQPIGLALSGADLYTVLERLPNGLQTRLGEGGGLVSGGEGQRVRLGRALLRKDVQLVILDEPFRGLDRTKRRRLLATVRNHWRHATLLCITHDIAETTDFARVLVVEDGQLTENDAPHALLARPQSSYGKLLTADENVRSQRWAAAKWRRLWLAQGVLRKGGEADAAHSPRSGPDELRQITGIGPVWAERLHQLGIHTIADLASATADHINTQLAQRGWKTTANLPMWIEQARRLTSSGKRGGEP
ncbi:MAG: ATP-binding cassette domain-containing protein [Caldilineaceae bacterium]|nr:ATP-binding cassette domain-containing protein [Caldilineaceae bacterium]